MAVSIAEPKVGVPMPESSTADAHEYPRVLVIATVSFNMEAGGGVTMSNLFRGWPKDRIAQIYSYGVKNKDKSVCRRFYHVQAIDRQFEFAEGRPLFGSGPASRALRRAKAYRAFKVAEQFQEAIAFARQFRPDVAYLRPMDKPSSYWWFCRDLCRLLGIPYVTHIMDDWPARYAADTRSGTAPDVPAGLRGVLKSARLRRSLGSMLNEAAANIAISPEMAAAFAERYARPFEAFHNTIDVARWESLSGERPAGIAGRDRPFLIRYIGAVVPDKELQSFKEIALAAKILADEGRSIRFELHCGPAWNESVDRYLAGVPVVRRGAFLPHTELPRALSEADLLVLPMNFDARSIRYVGYSMQTKGPEYMASGTPILVYGPPSNPNVRYARDAGWAEVIDHHDPTGASIASRIRTLMDDPDSARSLADQARVVARKNHDAAVVRTRFRRVLQEAAGGQPVP